VRERAGSLSGDLETIASWEWRGRTSPADEGTTAFGK
jgi:hypothetical protein